MDCADAKLRMEPCASGALVPEELALFEEHIAACEGCRLELELVRAMGKNGEEPGGAKNDTKSDDWTLDRIFGAEATKTAAAPVPESEALPIAPITAGSEAPAEPEPVEASASPDPATLFETSPNPLPTEPVVSTTDSGGEANGFDEPNPVGASFDDASTQALENSAVAEAAVAAAPALSPPPRTSPAAPPADGENSWDFEPADSKPEASLPEGSLFFAEETLARQGDAKKGKNTAKRMILWGAGALVGIALLAISLWVGLSVREDGASIKAGIPAGTSTTPTPTTDAAAESLASSGDGTAEAPGATTPEIVTQPADEAIAKPPATTLGARALSGGGVPPIPSSTRGGSQPVAPRSMTGAPAASSSKGTAKSTTAPSGSAAPKQTATGPDATTPKSASGTASRPTEVRPTPTEELDPEQLELRAPPPAPPTTPEQNVPFNGGAKGADTQTAPKTAPPVVSLPAEPAPAAPPADQVQRPIDRLHLATVTAEQASDLATLRKLKDTWKGLVRTSVGPDRARAKRELADCLWAIQSLTGRNSDKREALAAYREYLLNAPAGGADPRTVARMRQLEDALAESK